MSVEHQPLWWFVENLISCVDCVGVSSLVSVSFIEFCLASCNGGAVSVPVIILASFSLLLMCESVFLKMCMSVKLHMCCACDCFSLLGCVWLFFSTSQLCVFNAVCSFYARLPRCSSSPCFCRAQTLWAAYVLKPLAALMHPVLSWAHLVSFYQNAGGAS